MTDSAQLAQALDQAVDGDVIEMAAGGYQWLGGHTIGTGLTLRGATGDPDDVTVDLSTLTTGITDFPGVRPGYPVALSGITFLDYAGSWTLVGNEGDLFLESCVFRNIAATVVVCNGLLTVQGCLFEGNTGNDVINSNMNLTVSGSHFRNNQVLTIIEISFGDLAMETTTIENNTGVCISVPPPGQVDLTGCLVRGNQGEGAAIVLYGQNSLLMDNCTVTENAYGGNTGSALEIGYDSTATLFQCDILNNTGLDGYLGLESTTTFVCCDVELWRWYRRGTFVVDNQDCAVPVVGMTWGKVKSLYR